MRFKKSTIWFLTGLLAVLLIAPAAVADEVIGDDPSQAPPPADFQGLMMSMALAPSSNGVVDNGDGSYTYTQIVDENSTAPNYTSPGNKIGFENFCYKNQDYGWMHTFDEWNADGLVITSAKLMIRAWDVDSEVSHGYSGEYDGISVDGALLNPGYLQGNDQSWSETTFDVPISSIQDDGNVNVFVDIDMHGYGWATTLDKSVLTITYRLDGNKMPYQPELVRTPADAVALGSDLRVDVTGPVPADPEGDAVTYTYRWFVDVGTGGYVDDEFAGRGNHTGNTVPAADIRVGDLWRVQVTPVDSKGAVGSFATMDFPRVIQDNIPPTAEVQYSATSPTNQDVTATLVNESEPVTITNNGGSRIYTFTDNGSFTFEFRDAAGNMGSATAAVNWIDRVPPVAEVSYSATGPTSQDVVASLVNPSEPVTVTNNGGSKDYTFADNGDFTFEFVDAAGNKGSAAAAVSWIDRVPPTAEVSYSTAGPTNQDVVVSLVNPSEPVTVTNNDGSKDYTFTDNGDFTFEFVDAAGNKGSAAASVNWIDKVPPTAEVTYSTTSPTNQDVVASLVKVSEPITITGQGADSYTFADNGSYTFTFVDGVGNEGSAVATVTWIDKTQPTAQIVYSTLDPSSQAVTATIANESEPITIVNNNGSRQYTFTANGGFTFEIRDAVGNTATVTATVDWIYLGNGDISGLGKVYNSSHQALGSFNFIAGRNFLTQRPHPNGLGFIAYEDANTASAVKVFGPKSTRLILGDLISFGMSPVSSATPVAVFECRLSNEGSCTINGQTAGTAKVILKWNSGATGPVQFQIIIYDAAGSAGGNELYRQQGTVDAGILTCIQSR